MATYGKLRSTTIKGQAGTTWHVQLWKKDYSGLSTDITLQGEGFNVIWSGQGGTRDRQFINSECVLNIHAQNATDEALIYDIFSKGDRHYYVRIYKNIESLANIWWFGWVNPSFSKVENTPFPYTVNIKCSDSIGTFSKRKEETIDNLNWISVPTINSHIQDFGDVMGVNNNTTNLIDDGTFPLPNVNWNYAAAWSIPSGGGSIDYDGSLGTLRQTGVSITQGDDITFSITILNLAEGEVANIAITNESGDVMLQQTASVYLDFSTNGNHIVSGASLESATEIKLQPQTSATATFSVTDVSIIDGLISNPAPCPTNNDWFQTSVDWWREGDTYQSDDPFYKYRATKTAFRDKPIEKPTKYKEYDVLKGLLQTFNTVGVLSEGKYNFMQPNSWVGTLNGVLPFYKYANGDLQSVSSVSENNLLRVDGVDASILAGSNITYEAPFKEVTVGFEGTLDVVGIPTEQSANTELQLGYLDSNVGALKFRIDAVHSNKMLATAVETELGLDTSGNPYEFRNCFIWSETTPVIKLTNGADTYYLDTFISNNSQSGEWSPTSVVNTINSGWGAWAAETGGTSTNYPNATYPCSISKVGDYYETIVSYLDTIYVSDPPPISGDLSIILTTTVGYYKVRNVWNPNINTLSESYSFTPPAIVTQSDVLNSSSYVRAYGSEEDLNVSGVDYTASQDVNISEESYDLGDITIGANTVDSVATFANSLSQFNVAYTDSSGVIRFTSDGFTRSNGSMYSNITQLLADEFLTLQVEPLEILQADIYSSDISPSKLLKYSINANSLYNYYTFLGGKFSAQSETMSGEWYKIDSTSKTITQTSEKKSQASSLNLQSENSIKNLKADSSSVLEANSLGTTSTEYVSGTPINKIDLNGTLRGKIYDGQKLALHRGTGNSFLIVEVDGTQSTGGANINIQNITPDITIPIGSTLSVLTYDLSNVITGGSSGTPYGTPDTVKVNISHSEYAALDLVPKVLIPAPGVGKTIVPSSIMIFAERSTTETSRYHLFVGDRTNEILGSYHAKLPEFMAYETSHRTYMMNSVDGQTIQATPENVKLQMYSNRAFNGNIALTVYVTYTIMDI